ncbi:MAG: sodium:solute symporter family protein [Candidatus Marinimicrobia bacterium]|nr:sodium:solute symporter family protein [Candidatus Neomarinimicrobiota bacterium]
MKLMSLDWLIVALYMAGMLAIGFWAMTKIKDPGGYLLGKRKMGKWLMIAALFGGGTSSNHPISVASASYKSGFSGMWISLAYMFVMPFYWLFPPIFRRARIVTMVDFLRLRYGRFMGVLFNVVGLAHVILVIGVGIKTSSIVIRVLTGGAVPEMWAQVAVVALILAYSLPGGILAAYTTDLIQGLLIVVLSFLLIPFLITETGGFQGLHAAVPPRFFEMVAAEGISTAWIVWFVVATLFSAAAWNTNSTYGTARNEIAARMSIFGSIIKRFCTVGWMLAGIFALAIYGVGTIEGDDAFARLAADFLPVGLRGLMLASVLAAVMSTVDANMIFASSIVTNNIYKPVFRPEASPAHYLLAARCAGLAAVLLGWALATQVGSVVRWVLMCEQICGLVGVSIFGALIWRRATHWGAIASVCVMTPLFYYGTVYRQDWTLSQWTPFYLLPGLAAFVLVSLCTRQHSLRSVREFYARLDTPLGEEHRLAAQGIEVDLVSELDGETIEVSRADHDISKRLWLLDFLTWPWLLLTGRARLADYKVDLIGFFGVIAFVALFVWGMYWLSTFGA